MNNQTLTALNGYLFEQLERLNDEDMSDETLKKECKRTQAITEVSKNIIENAKTLLQATKFSSEYSHNDMMPKILQTDNGEN